MFGILDLDVRHELINFVYISASLHTSIKILVFNPFCLSDVNPILRFIVFPGPFALFEWWMHGSCRDKRLIDWF